jgi:hypothetical protein
VKPSLWKVQQAKAYKVLKSISTDQNTLHQILGDEYLPLLNRLKGIPSNSNLNSQANKASSSSGASRTDNPRPQKRQRVQTNSADIIDLT